jgi:tetratricopeptide (TPR) repeat protein/predicted Ser/Thr protein kinase
MSGSGSNPPRRQDDESLGLARTERFDRNLDSQREDAEITRTATTSPLHTAPPATELSDAINDWASLAGLLRAVAATPEVAPPARLEPGTVVNDSFRIEGELGAGGMGVVYLARDLRLGRRVALKLHAKLSAEEGFDRLMREATAMARLNHPNVLTVHEVGTLDGHVFIAMEYVDGWNLRTWVRDRKPDWREIHRVLVDAGRGLAAAHAADLVHRDFKPDNILIGKDGRVMVADFGLARAAAAATPTRRPKRPSTDPGETDTLDSKLTVTGALMGTPAYMAPEQGEAADVDDRADQFAFCVSLYEALYGKRPFAGSSFKELLENIEQGNVREPPPERKIPRWIRDVIMRGIRADPEERYPSMDALLDDLANDPVAARRRLMMSAGAMLAVAAVAATIGIVMVRKGGGSPGDVCGGAADEIAGTWSPDRRRAIRSAFLASKAPGADNTWRGVRALVDGYTSSWMAHYRIACEATHVHKTQSERIMDRRMACLEKRLDSLDALLGVFESMADKKVVSRAIRAATGLPSIPVCSNREYLDAQVKPPDDARTATRVNALRKQLARATATLIAGRTKEAKAVTREILTEARALSYEPLIAEVLLHLGRAQLRNNEHSAAAKTLEESYFTALKSRHDEVSGLAAAALVDLYHRQAKWKEATRWTKHALAEAERAGGTGDMPVVVWDSVGGLLASRGKYDQALAYRRKALTLQREIDADHPRVAQLLSSIGTTLDAKGDMLEAAKELERALALQEHTFGRDHLVLAVTLGNLGLVYNGLGKHDRAIAVQRRAVDISRKNLGEDVLETGYAWLNYGVALFGKGVYPEAKEAFLKALAIVEKRLGKKHPDVALCLNSLGVVEEASNHLEQALAYHRRALANHIASKGENHVDVAIVRNNIAVVLGKSKRYDEAIAEYLRAIRIFEKINAKHPRIAHSLHGLSTMYVEKGQPAKAIAPAERALELITKNKMDPLLRAKTELALGDALWLSGRDRRRALELVTAASAGFDKLGKRGQSYAEYARTWLKRGSPPAHVPRPQ